MVVDVETTGLDPGQDVILTIGAVAIEALSIDLKQSFDVTLRQPVALESDNVLLHGVSPQAVAAGDDPAAALRSFAGFARGAPLVAFRGRFDKAMLEAGVRRHLGASVDLPMSDAEDWFLAFAADPHQPKLEFDDWLARYGLEVGQRHNACADAMATAELALICLHRAHSQGVWSWGAFERHCKAARRLAEWPG